MFADIVFSKHSFYTLVFNVTLGKAFQQQNHGGWKWSSSLTAGSSRPQGGDR